MTVAERKTKEACISKTKKLKPIEALYLLEKLKTTRATTDGFAEPRKAPTVGENHVALNLVKTIRSIEENRHDAQQNAIFNELRQFGVTA